MRFKRCVRGVVSDRSGSTAIEFAIVATAFFLLLFATIEFGMFMLTQVAIESAVAEASRLAVTGQGGAKCQSRVQAVENQIKDKLQGLINPDSLIITQGVAGGSNSLSPDICTDDPSNPTSSPANGTCKKWIEINGVSGFQGAAGASDGSGLSGGQVYEIRVLYNWRVMFPIIGEFFTSTDNNGGSVAGSVPIRVSTVVKEQKYSGCT